MTRTYFIILNCLVLNGMVFHVPCLEALDKHGCSAVIEKGNTRICAYSNGRGRPSSDARLAPLGEGLDYSVVNLHVMIKVAK